MIDYKTLYNSDPFDISIKNYHEYLKLNIILKNMRVITIFP